MGAWVCLKALQKIPGIKKGFALSTWNMARNLKNIDDVAKLPYIEDEYFVLNTSAKDIFQPVIENPSNYNIVNDGVALSNKQIVMVDEHPYNKDIAEVLKKENTDLVYQVWPTDHGFTNRRVSLMNMLLEFLKK
jgi:hypothetical protein